MFYQICLSPQVKRCAIITYKHDIYELPRELLNDLRRRFLGNWEMLGRCLKPAEWWRSAQFPRQNESFVNTSEKILKNRN